jgi:hypothetical protein
MDHPKIDCLLTPIDISHPVPVYNSRGRVMGYGVTVRYYVGKMFTYSPHSDKYTETDNALQWVCKMEEQGYKLVRSPKIHDSPQCGAFDVYMICDYTHQFNELPFFNAGKRAWRFWLKHQAEVARIQRNKEVMQTIDRRTR